MLRGGTVQAMNASAKQKNIFKEMNVVVTKTKEQV